jgi:UDP-N-acetylmuramate--alanine ligase
MKYHFIGIGGISMKGIAEYLEKEGNIITGSDLKTGGHRASNITSDIDLVVRTSAVNPGSPGWVEVEEAEKKGIKVIKRSELLGKITKNKKLIAVSGMHGKTTITTMAGLSLINAKFDPTVLVGEKVKDFNDEVLRVGKSDWWVAEVCEYDRSFLDFFPEIIILTNIEEEHLDTYPGGLPEILEAYTKYLDNIKDGGIIIACQDDKNVKDVIGKSKTKARVIYYGLSAEVYNISKLNYELGVLGEHNRLNALSVIALADYLKIDQKIIEETLKNFHGAKRRMEYKGNVNGAKIFDDYGHHPTEISATISAIKEKYNDKKLTVVFWPHQYKRIKPLMKNFAEAFLLADNVILKPIFLVPGRDEKLDISSENITTLIGEKAKVMKTDEEIVNYLKKNLNESNVLLTIGIPPVYKIAEELARTSN